MVPWAGLQCVILVFPDHTHFFKGYHLLRHGGPRQNRIRHQPTGESFRSVSSLSLRHAWPIVIHL